jgi:hypothetical protein
MMQLVFYMVKKFGSISLDSIYYIPNSSGCLMSNLRASWFNY